MENKSMKEDCIMANTLKDYREKKGLTQEELAEKAKVPVELIKEIEGEIVILPASQANSISNVLGVEPSLIFDPVAEYETARKNQTSDEILDLKEKLCDYEYLCASSAERLASLIETLREAKNKLEDSGLRKTTEFCMIETVDIALETIVKDLTEIVH